jgi:hypothetical protein
LQALALVTSPRLRLRHASFAPKFIKNATKPKWVYEISLKFQAATLSLFTSILIKYYNNPIYSPPFHHLLRFIIILFPKKNIGINIFKIQIENYVQKIIPNDPNSPFKKKEKEGGEGRSQLDGQ